jgi:hypothetical protein
MFKLTPQLYIKETAVIFASVALLHLASLVYGWQVTIGPWAMPSWVSIVVVVVAGVYAIKALSLINKK